MNKCDICHFISKKEEEFSKCAQIFIVSLFNRKKHISGEYNGCINQCQHAVYCFHLGKRTSFPCDSSLLCNQKLWILAQSFCNGIVVCKNFFSLLNIPLRLNSESLCNRTSLDMVEGSLHKYRAKQNSTEV